MSRTFKSTHPAIHAEIGDMSDLLGGKRLGPVTVEQPPQQVGLGPRGCCFSMGGTENRTHPLISGLSSAMTTAIAVQALGSKFIGLPAENGSRQVATGGNLTQWRR